MATLKAINPLYAQINLPKSASDFNLCDTITQCIISNQTTHSGDDLITDEEREREPMVSEVPESEEQDLYHDYTIHAPRENEKASHLYQLFRINGSPIDAHSKQLDLLCFPDLYPHGQHESRKVPLGPADYIKALLQSRDPRFRRNIQFIFSIFIKPL